MRRIILSLLLSCLLLVPSWAEAGRLFTSGFEENNGSLTVWTSSSGTFTTTSPHSGTYAGAFTSGQNASRNLSAVKTSGTLWTRFYWKTSTTATANVFARWNNSGGSANWTLTKTNTGAITLTNSVTTTAATTSTTVSTGTWYRIEVQHVIPTTTDGTDGSLTLKLFLGDDTTPLETPLTISGEDVLNTDLFTLRFVESTGGATVFTYDDVAINDETGTFQNTYAGPGKIYMLVPDSDVSVNFTPTGAASNFDTVNELPGAAPDDDTTYNSSSTANIEDRLGLTDLGAEVPSDADIVLVDVYGRVRGEGTSGVRNMRFLLWDEGGSQTNGPTTTLNDSTAYAIASTAQHLVFDAGTRTKANIADFNAGYEPLTSDPTRVTTLWANVEWIESSGAPSANFFRRRVQ